MATDAVMQSMLDALMLIGLHPFKKTWFGYIRAFIFAFSFLIMYILNLMGVVTKYTGIESLGDSVDAIPAGHQVVVKVFSMILIHSRFQKLFRNMNALWPDDVYGPELENKLLKKKTIFKNFFITYKAIISFTTIVYVCKPLFTVTRTFATAWYIPCDEARNSCYIPIVVGQTIYIVYLAFAVAVFDVIFFGFLFHIHCEIDKLKYGLENLVIREDVEGDEPQVYQKFCGLVKHHDFLVEFTKNIDDVYSLQLLNHIATISATIVFGIFFMSMNGFPPPADKLYRYIPYLITYHFQLYTYCVCGEEMYNQLQSIGDVIYELHWYVKHQPKLRNGVLMVMGVAQLKNKLTIGGIWKLNLATFMSVLKTSVSLLAFMQTINKAD